jgi:hypothetical protein
MTGTVYTASFVDAEGKKFHGSIFWGKYTPKRLVATLCPHIDSMEVDYPIWTLSSVYSRKGLEILSDKMKAESLKLHLVITSEGETKFAVN